MIMCQTLSIICNICYNRLGDFMKSILITGGSKGLGKELVKSFINKGYKVYYTYYNY